MATFDAGQTADLRRAWDRLAPDDDEVRFAATRIAARLRRPSHHSILRSRSAAVASGAVIVVAALAYAAQAGRVWVDRTLHGAPAPAERAPISAPEPSVLPSAAPRLHLVIAPSAATPSPSAPPRVAPAHRAKRKTTEPASVPAVEANPAAPNDDASWRLVDRALTDHDDTQAKALLEGLSTRSRDARTRAAASLGLAQLHAGRGECAEARRIAVALAAEPGVPMSMARRAQRILGVCFAR